MSFLGNLFGGSKKNNEQHMMQEVAPGLMLPRAFADHWADIKRTARQFIAINAMPADTLTLRQSKFGHYPCIPKGFNYPKSREGKYMYPLAQINCSELPSNNMLPASGYLQFYISLDDLWGLSDGNIPGDYKVLFFEEAEVATREENMSFLEEVASSDEVPMNKPHSITFQNKTEYIGLGDYHAVREGLFNLDNLLKQHPSIEGELEDFANYNFQPIGHKLGGYAYFTQGDPREHKPEIQEYILLFQMDSVDDIMWGDAGVANFFIHPNDLAAKDFSRVFYTWDCC